MQPRSTTTASMEPSRERDGDATLRGARNIDSSGLQWSRRANATETLAFLTVLLSLLLLQWSRRANATETSLHNRAWGSAICCFNGAVARTRRRPSKVARFRGRGAEAST